MFHLNWFLPSISQQLDVLVFFNDSVHWDNLNISHPSRLLRLFRTSALTPVESRWEKFHFPLKKWALVWRYVCFKKVFGIIGLKWRKRSKIRRCLYTYKYIYTHICTRIYEQTLHIYIPKLAGNDFESRHCWGLHYLLAFIQPSWRLGASELRVEESANLTGSLDIENSENNNSKTTRQNRPRTPVKCRSCSWRLSFLAHNSFISQLGSRKTSAKKQGWINTW